MLKWVTNRAARRSVSEAMIGTERFTKVERENERAQSRSTLSLSLSHDDLTIPMDTYVAVKEEKRKAQGGLLRYFF